MAKTGDRWANANKITAKLIKLIPADQQERVFSQDWVDIETSFLGFVDTYYYLSKIIPTHFTVIDFGSAYNAQAFFFPHHKQYIAVDGGLDVERFCPPNGVIYPTSIQRFLAVDFPALNLDVKEVFAICNYVGTEESLLIGSIFPNLFCYYPHGKRFLRSRLKC